MIMVQAKVAADGLLLDFEARGHAGQGSRGSDLACAAFTTIVRTACVVLAGLPGALVKDRAQERGMIDFHVEAMPDSERDRAIGMSAFLLEGIAALAKEYPSGVGFSLETVRRN